MYLSNSVTMFSFFMSSYKHRNIKLVLWINFTSDVGEVIYVTFCYVSMIAYDKMSCYACVWMKKYEIKTYKICKYCIIVSVNYVLQIRYYHHVIYRCQFSLISAFMLVEKEQMGKWIMRTYFATEKIMSSLW